MRFCVSISILVLLGAGILFGVASPVQANKLNEWSISCSVDEGAITRKGKVWRFSTSANRCPGGSWKQRAELSTRHEKPNLKGAYLFTSHVAVTSRQPTRFDIFQIHDGRRSCAPPLKVTVLRSGQLELWSDVEFKNGSCIYGKLTKRPSSGRMRFDGTEHELKILLNFDGKGGFDTTVWLDGKVEATGRYDQPTQANTFHSTKFYFKHGAYSQKMFNYVLTSRGMKVKKVRVKK